MNTEQTDKVMENEDLKVLWDFNFQVDRFIEARRPDIILVRKKKKACVIIDIAVPGDIRTQIKGDDRKLKSPAPETTDFKTRVYRQ